MPRSTPHQRLRVVELRAKHPELSNRAISVRIGLSEKVVGSILLIARKTAPKGE